MSSRQEILDKCRRSIHKRLPKPDLTDLAPTVYPDTYDKFISMAESIGCVVRTAKSEDEIDKIISEVYPDAVKIASNLPCVKSATLNPDTVATAQELNGTDVGVVRAAFGVAENGSVWIPQDMKERDICFISEYLVAVMPRDAVVNNMHEAYGRICFNDYGFGVFIAGPSKTADIAQVLVVGAQAARGMTLILLDNPSV